MEHWLGSFGLNDHKTMNASTIQVEVMRAGMLKPLVPLADREYDYPRSDWVTGVFYRWYREVIQRLSGAYTAEAWDCDDYADSFKLFAGVCHRKMNRKSAIAVGALYFTSERLGPHAINAVITSDLGLVFIDPQVGQIISLTDKERESVCMLRF